MSKAVVYKFPFQENTSTFLMPINAKPLKVAMQHDKPVMWALLNAEEEVVERRFAIYGTGQPIHDAERHAYVGTFFDGPFVLHVFEVIA